MKSFSEIDTVSKRASRAVGFSWGLSEEIGKNIRLLEMFGFKGVESLSEYFKSLRKKKYENIKLISKRNKPKKNFFCPINLGVNFLDQITLLKKNKKIDITNVAFPILFLPFLSRSSEIMGKKINCKIDKYEFLLNFNHSIFTSFKSNIIQKKAKKISIIFFEKKDSFKKDNWNNLTDLSRKTFVDESDDLKKIGAGAGLTDND